MSWYSVRTRPNPRERENLVRVLFETGSQGVHEDGDFLVAWFDDAVAQTDVALALDKAGYDGQREVRAAEAIDWSESWKEKLKAHVAGKIRIAPPWLADANAAAPADITIVIDPGMAFGTGDHGSTRCALRLMQQVVKPGDRVADLGSGSAVLSIAAAILGAAKVVGIENDPDAMGNASENVSRNGVGDVVTLLEADAATVLPLVAPFGVIVANIISSVLLPLLPVMRSALANNGSVILSGILVEERADFVHELEARGWKMISEDNEEGWCALAIRPR